MCLFLYPVEGGVIVNHMINKRYLQALTVNAIMCLLSLTHWAKRLSRSSGESKYSFVSSSLWAVLAISEQ